MKKQKISLRKGWQITAIILSVLYALILLLLLILWDTIVFVFFTIVLGVPAFISWMLATQDRRIRVEKEYNILSTNSSQSYDHINNEPVIIKEQYKISNSQQLTNGSTNRKKEMNTQKSNSEAKDANYDNSSTNTSDILHLQEGECYTFEELRAGALKKIPKCKGIYKVYMPHDFTIKFRSDSDAPYTKNQLKSVDVLQNKWIEICKHPGYEDGLLYIGKSTNLRRRISEFVRTGYGEAINHYGGSAIFQLENNKQLQIRIFECENCEERESQEIATYISYRKVMPLANWQSGTKKG